MKYNYYVILLHFKNENEDVNRVIRKIPKGKVLIVDRNIRALKDYPVVYQEYEKNIQAALACGLDLIKKYKKLNLIFPSGHYYRAYIEREFCIFCQVNILDLSVFEKLSEETLKKNEAFVIISDDDLVEFIRII